MNSVEREGLLQPRPQVLTTSLENVISHSYRGGGPWEKPSIPWQDPFTSPIQGDARLTSSTITLVAGRGDMAFSLILDWAESNLSLPCLLSTYWLARNPWTVVVSAARFFCLSWQFVCRLLTRGLVGIGGHFCNPWLNSVRTGMDVFAK